MTLYTTLLMLIVFLPALAALVLAFFPKGMDEVVRYISFFVTIVVLVMAGIAFMTPGELHFEHRGEAAAYLQDTFNVPWIPSFDIYFFTGLDGISFPLVMLTVLICALAMAASWSITKHVKAYCVLFLLLETGMIGVFMALDFFLFYVFWEVMLLPMYFLIGVWGGPRREYAAIKFFLYTLFGSVLMLLALLMLYFHSDLREIAKRSDLYGDSQAGVKWEQLHLHPEVSEKLIGAYFRLDEAAEPLAFRVVDDTESGETAAAWDENSRVVTVSMAPDKQSAWDVIEAIEGNEQLRPLGEAVPATELTAEERQSDAVQPLPGYPDEPLHSFNMMAMAAQGQHTDSYSPRLQWWCFLLLFIGFAIKVPSVPLHTWLPDAHVEAPTPISMILAGVLLKMGGYGIIRICYPICPFGGYELMYFVCWVGVISMIYGALAALAQTDFKRMVAYSSVSHMGYVVLGLGVWSAVGDRQYNASYWNMGIQGAMFQMIGHGISSAGMFFMVGIIYDRVHHRDMNKFGGLFGKMPFYTAMAMGLFFAGLGLPGLCGFIGEVFVVLSVYQFNVLMAVLSAGVVILTAAYILWAIQRVYLGAEYKGPGEDQITPSNLRERTIGVTLLALAILFGVRPYHYVFDYMDETITRQVDDLAEWTKRNEPALKGEPATAGALADDDSARPAAAETAISAAAPVAAAARPAPPGASAFGPNAPVPRPDTPAGAD